ncbi:selenide, water dikinase [Synergistales bacterium]|nr:selenide, water dikinase [Synergistales bacterium]
MSGLPSLASSALNPDLAGRVLADWSDGEDAALWRIDDARYGASSRLARLGILTLDFITPVVDDPYIWGQTAAANSISDVFAMGGRPIVALNIVAFPTATLGLDVLKKVLEGGVSKTNEAGTFLLGGHSVQDDEPKYGMVVYGEVEEDKVWRTTGAHIGDVLILTKPLGTGIIATGVKAGMVDDPSVAAEAAKWMTKLNSIPQKLTDSLHRAVRAATDVTGFGLVGHILDMTSHSLDFRLSLDAIPLIKGVTELADMGLIPEGAYRNRFAYEDRVDILALDATLGGIAGKIDALFDAQTSGGLLLAISPDRAEEMLAVCKGAGFDRAVVIGEFVRGTGKVSAR